VNDESPILWQFEHLLHGSKDLVDEFLENLLFRQFTALAIILAVEVLPVPFWPTNKKACGNVFDANILLIVSLAWRLSISENVCGRYFR